MSDPLDAPRQPDTGVDPLSKPRLRDVNKGAQRDPLDVPVVRERRAVARAHADRLVKAATVIRMPVVGFTPRPEHQADTLDSLRDLYATTDMDIGEYEDRVAAVLLREASAKA